jgi:hypothetical protein
LLYDNEADPAQLHNLINDPARAAWVARLDSRLSARLQAVGDDFVSGPEIIRREGYAVGPNGDIAIMPSTLPEPYSFDDLIQRPTGQSA